jgi:hypothetical protein
VIAGVDDGEVATLTVAIVCDEAAAKEHAMNRNKKYFARAIDISFRYVRAFARVVHVLEEQ